MSRLVSAVIQPHRLDEVRSALEVAGVRGPTVSAAASTDQRTGIRRRTRE